MGVERRPAQAGEHLTNRGLRTPRAAAIAGILFAVLYATSFSLVLRQAPGRSGDVAEWLARDGEYLVTGFGLLPYAGIAFLWFMAVVRDAIGYFEDQFFSTLFFGSGVLFLAMVFLFGALASGTLDVYLHEPVMAQRGEVLELVRAVTNEALIIYSMRMAGMFTFVLGTIWLRTRLMPRWFAIATFATALLLLFSVGFSHWMVLVFPVWVFSVSMILLLRVYRPSGAERVPD